MGTINYICPEQNMNTVYLAAPLQIVGLDDFAVHMKVMSYCHVPKQIVYYGGRTYLKCRLIFCYICQVNPIFKLFFVNKNMNKYFDNINIMIFMLKSRRDLTGIS